MPIILQCPGCEKKLKPKVEVAGKRVKCPGCGHIISVPATQPDSDPTEVVLAFIADYFRWNQAAHQRVESTGQSDAEQIAAVDAAMNDAVTVLGPYFLPGADPRPASFGDPSKHQPGREVVTSAKTKADRSVVSTRLTQLYGQVGMIWDFTYRLSRVDGRWYLEGIDEKFVGHAEDES